MVQPHHKILQSTKIHALIQKVVPATLVNFFEKQIKNSSIKGLRLIA